MKQKAKSTFASVECDGSIRSIKNKQTNHLQFISNSCKLICVLILGIISNNLTSQIVLPYDSLRANPMIAMTAKPVVGTFDLFHMKYIPPFDPSGASSGLVVEKQFNYHDGSNTLVNLPIELVYIYDVNGYVYGESVLYGNQLMIMTMADIDGNNTDEMIYVLEDPNEMLVMRVHGSDVTATSGVVHTPTYAPDGQERTTRVRLNRVDVDYDGIDEVALSYYSVTDASVHVEIWKGGAGLGGTTLFNMGALVLPYTYDGIQDKWDVTFGDFNLDGRPEMVFAVEAQVTLYQMNYQSTSGMPVEFIEKAEVIYLNLFSNFNGTTNAPSLVVGDFNGDLIPEIQMVSHNDADGNVFSRVMLQVGDDPATSNVDYLEKLELAFSLENNGYANYYVSDWIDTYNSILSMDLVAADIDNNGRDELVVYFKPYSQYGNAESALPQGIHATVFSCNTASLSDWKPVTSYDIPSSQWSIQVSSVGSIAEGNLPYPVDVSLSGYSALNTTFGSSLNAQMDKSIYSMGFGDTSGDAYTIRNPRKTQMSNISQPVFVLSAPPVHSDDINGVFTDLACSGDNCQDFSTSLTLETTQNISVENTIHSDWSMGASVGLGFDFPFGLGNVSAKLGVTYGGSYENINASSTTVTLTEERTADVDDSYLVSKVDYVVHEYDVFKGPDFVTKLISVHPKLINGQPQMTWINGKNLEGLIETHEIGNILSYRRPNDTQASDNEQLVSLNNYDVTSGASSITFDQAEEASLEETTSWDQGLSRSLDFQLGALEGGIEDAYNWGGISTHGVSYQTSTSVQVNFGSLNTSYSGPYFIKPLISLNNGGGISVEYEAEPILPTQGSSNLWNTSGTALDYTDLDLSWSLPWRLDVQRGVQNVDPVNTRKCRSIWLTKPLINNQGYDASAADPFFTIKDPIIRNALPGSTVTINARVFNYSTEVSEQSLVSFYLGHPEIEGLLLTNTDGVTSVVVPPIEPQQYVDVTFTVILPMDDTNGRLYGVIDPLHTMEEFHENNNLGWVPMGVYYDYPQEIFSSVAEYSYDSEKLRVMPNPASNIAQVMIELGKNTQQAILNVIDISGRLVHSEMVFSNSQRQLDLSNLVDGIYFIEVVCENKKYTTKLMVNK
jgi:hypothetical protein